MLDLLYQRNDIQFPRLLAEIFATHPLDIQKLALRMNIKTDQVEELLQQAQQIREHESKPSTEAQPCTGREEEWQTGVYDALSALQNRLGEGNYAQELTGHVLSELGLEETDLP